jgi:hypothetical protein
MKSICRRSCFVLCHALIVATLSGALIVEPSACGGEVTSADYIRLLEKWMPTARHWTHAVPDHSDLAYYGTGGHEHWAVQAQCSALAAAAALATAPELDEPSAGETRQQLRERALSLLRYTLHTHKSGAMPCTTGKAWGYSWISALGLERMSLAVTALKPWLTDDDQQRLRKLLIAECDFLLKGYPVVGAIDASKGKNKPESNIWNGAILYRTATLYPDAPHAAEYREKASVALLNGISIPADAKSDTLYNGRKLSQWHVGPNYTDQFALNHHGYMNLGYMEICLSNVAMLHFFCLENNLPIPAELYHHVDKLWQLTKSLTFDDGRLWRIGGDTRMRYCYCQDYTLPAWLMILDHLGDPDAAKFEQGWIQLVAKEQSGNPQGAFLSNRLAKLRDVSPFYYCRLEGDRAGSLAMGAMFRRQLARTKPAATARVAPLTAWSDDFHGAAMVQGPRRRASWVWKSGQRPCGTVVPADRSDMVEWQWNLVGLIRGAGCSFQAVPQKGYVLYSFPGGFATCGSYQWTASANPGEGSEAEDVALARTAMVVLPDDATTVILQRANASRPIYINQILGLNYQVPNDVFNGSTRTYRSADLQRTIVGAGGRQAPAREVLACGKAVNIDGRVNVRVIYGDEELSLFRPGMRNATMGHNIPMAFSGAGASLYCDVVSLPARDEQRFYQAHERLYDVGAVLGVDVDPQARSHSAPDSQIKVVEVTGADKHRYLIAANLSDQPQQAAAAVTGGFSCLCGKNAVSRPDGLQFDLAANEVIVLRLNPRD